MSVERHDGYRLWIGGPVPPGAAAMTLGSLIIVRREHARDAHLLRHELVHVEQYRRQRFVPFLARYLAAYIAGRLAGYPHLAAYRRIPAEAEAEWRARRASIDG